MKTVWTKGLSEDQKVELRKDFLSSLATRRRLQKLLEEKINASYDTSTAKDGYSNPNWAYLQADARGYERALKEVISMISE